MLIAEAKEYISLREFDIILIGNNVFIYPMSPPWTVCDKWNKAGLNSEFSFSEIGCLIKSKESSLHYYLPIAGEKKKMDSCLF